MRRLLLLGLVTTSCGTLDALDHPSPGLGLAILYLITVLFLSPPGLSRVNGELKLIRQALERIADKL